MTPVALLGLRAVYQSGQVKMTWKFPSDSPETVHIYAVKSHKDQLELDLRSHIAKDLRECNGGYSFKYNNLSGNDVKKVEFCAYLSSHNETSPDISKLSGMSDCFASVIAGEADVVFQIKRKPCGCGLVGTKIILQLSADVDPGILGYSYNFYGKEIAVEFPGKIHNGITEFMPIALIENADPVVKVVAGMNSDVSVEQKRISFWRSFLARLLKKSRY